MNTLVSASEVVEIAFGARESMLQRVDDPTLIEAAQYKYLRPVFGALYDAMCEGRYTRFRNEYIKVPLALYVKAMLIPSLGVRTEAVGMIAPGDQTFDDAPTGNVDLLRRDLFARAELLLRRAVEYVELNSSMFPEYDPRSNILNRVSVKANIIMSKTNVSDN